MSETFDIITLWHSFEHIQNPDEVLTIIDRLLSNHLRLQYPS